MFLHFNRQMITFKVTLNITLVLQTKLVTKRTSYYQTKVRFKVDIPVANLTSYHTCQCSWVVESKALKRSIKWLKDRQAATNQIILIFSRFWCFHITASSQRDWNKNPNNKGINFNFYKSAKKDLFTNIRVYMPHAILCHLLFCMAIYMHLFLSVDNPCFAVWSRFAK